MAVPRIAGFEFLARHYVSSAGCVLAVRLGTRRRSLPRPHTSRPPRGTSS